MAYHGLYFCSLEDLSPSETPLCSGGGGVYGKNQGMVRLTTETTLSHLQGYYNGRHN